MGSVPLAGTTDSRLGEGICLAIHSSTTHIAATLGTVTVFADTVTHPPPCAHSIFYLSGLILKAQMDAFSKANIDLISTDGKEPYPVNP